MTDDDGFFARLSRRGWLGEGLQDLQQRDDIASLERRHRVEAETRLEDHVSQQRQIDALTRELAAVRTALEVLGHMLVEVGGLDPAELDARMKAAIASDPSTRPPVQPGKCDNCGLKFPVERLEQTPNGQLCKRCLALGA